MKTTVRLKANEKLAQRYRDLLTREWSSSTLVQALDLLTDQLPARERAQAAKATIPPELDRLVPAFLSSSLVDVPNCADKPSKARNGLSIEGLSDQVARSAFFLLFQATYAIKGKLELFADSQSLLFLCAVHYLLPALDGEKLTADRNSLVSALWLNTVVGDFDFSHVLYLRAVLFRYLSQRSREISALVESFKLTDPEDHNYVTKAQAAWMSMLENDRIGEAKTFLLNVYRNCPQGALDEVREMLDETFAAPPPTNVTAEPTGRQR